jgi:hypothetical protein
MGTTKSNFHNASQRSRLCKAVLFERYKQLQPQHAELTYAEAKQRSVEYQRGKKVFLQLFPKWTKSH